MQAPKRAPGAVQKRPLEGLTGTAPTTSSAAKAKKSCFVIMAIGEQHEPNGTVMSAGELKARYNDLIREALVKSHADLEVIRADEVAAGGGITEDIFQRLMYSDYVVADISFPNPNVYYELGIRHACRTGTIVIREKGSSRAPFDVSTQRYIEYENTPSGLKALTEEFRRRFDYHDKNPSTPDNSFLTYAQFKEYQFQQYGQKSPEAVDDTLDAMMSFIQYPELLTAFQSGASQEEILRALSKNPAAVKPILRLLIKSGTLKIPGL